MAIANAITGLCQMGYLDDLYMGILMSGSYRDAEGGVQRRGTGGVSRLSSSFFVPGGSLRIMPTNASTWLDTTDGKIVRAATGYPCSDLPNFSLIFVSGINMKYTGCKATSVTLESAVGDPLTCSLEWLATGISDTAIVAPAEPGDIGDLWEWYDAVVTVAGGSYSLESFTISVSNSIRPSSDLDGFGQGISHRTPKRLFIGDERVTLSVRTKNPIPSSVRGNLSDAPATDLGFTATFTNALAGSLAITGANFMNSSGENPIEQEDGTVIYSYGFEAQINSQAFTCTMTAPTP